MLEFAGEPGHLRPVLRRTLASIAVLAALAVLAQADEMPAASRAGHERGPLLYDRLCSPCHGQAGDGAGPAAPWLWPPPRDFTTGEYKWRTTLAGVPPTRSDLAQTIRYGAAGTSMHAFADILDGADIEALIDVLQSFGPRPFATPAAPSVSEPNITGTRDARIRTGRAAFLRLGCTTCHGVEARGDGPAAKHLRDRRGRPAAPYDLRARPLRRPRAPDEDATAAIYRSIATGLSGTAMPGHEGAAPPDELFAVATYIDSIRFRGTLSIAERLRSVAKAIELDGKGGVVAGRWPGVKKVAPWSDTITLNGVAPRQLGPAQASLSARQCARCHAPQYRQWRSSMHARAGSPGLLAQLLPMEAHGKGASVESCQRCHAPLAEQLPLVRAGHFGQNDDSSAYRGNPFYSPPLREEGINCASCHVRKWKRHGPPAVPGSKLLGAPDYPLERLAIYERSDFCIGCHQLPPRLAVAGRPLLDTYREWLEGPYMRRGIQCQHCHMSNREHEWKGVHDPETFRQALGLEAIARRHGEKVSVKVRLENRGAGHYLPTTPTPAAWLVVELVDDGERAIAGTTRRKRIGRHLRFRAGTFEEIEDTRIAPGESLELAAGYEGPATRRATGVRVRVEVAPDDYYAGLYRRRLSEKKLEPKVRALFEDALQRAERSRYRAISRVYTL